MKLNYSKSYGKKEMKEYDNIYVTNIVDRDSRSIKGANYLLPCKRSYRMFKLGNINRQELLTKQAMRLSSNRKAVYQLNKIIKDMESGKSILLVINNNYDEVKVIASHIATMTDTTIELVEHV